MLTAAALYDRAVDHSNAGRHTAARRTLTEASRRTDDADLRARIDGTLAYLDAETGDPDRGLQRCRTALDTPGVSAHTRAVLTSQLGLIELRRGDLSAAMPHLDAAISALGDDPARLGRVVLNRGLVHLEHGDIRSADRDFATAAEAFERTGDDIELAKARHNRGYAALIAGDLVLALRLMDEARPRLSTLSPASLAVCDLDRAEVLRAAGMATEASRLLRAAASAFGARRLRQMQADAELALAVTLTDREPASAASVARRASRRYRSRGNETAALRADACELAASVLAGRRGQALRSRIDSTVEALRRMSLIEEARALALQGARLEVERGRAASATATLEEDHGDRVTTVILAHEVAAELAAASGRRSRAMEEARRGLDVLNGWQSRFGSIDLQSTTSARGRRLALTGIAAALDGEDPSVVFEWAERTRSLSSRIMPVRPPEDEAAALELTELRTLRLSGAGPERATELEERIRRRRWSGDGSRVLAPLHPLDAVRSGVVGAGAELVSYLWTGDRLAALAVGRSVRIVDLGPWSMFAGALDGLLADLDMAAADLPEAMASVVRRSLNERLDRLDELLLSPLGLRADRVVITPAGALSGVPWAMLRSLRSRSLTLPVSASRWLDQTAQRWRIIRAGFVAGPGVDRAGHEVVASASGWTDAAVLTSDGATCAAASAMASSVDVLHVSAHGRHSADNPLFSGLELADGPWFGYDIDQLDPVPEVVVLSACEVGRSATAWGQEALGMAQSWLHAGTRAVIAAPASVNDALASTLLPAVHTRMRSGGRPSDAVAAATEVPSAFQVYGAGW